MFYRTIVISAVCSAVPAGLCDEECEPDDETQCGHAHVPGRSAATTHSPQTHKAHTM